MQNENALSKDSRFLVAYYTGTGSTALVAECFYQEFKRRGLCGALQNISCTEAPAASHDLLVVIFPVHASNAPKAVYEWIDALPLAEQLPTVKQLPAAEQLPSVKQQSSVKQLPSTKQQSFVKQLPSTKQQPFVGKTPAVVISVSGGGEIIPNTASRVSSIKRLEKKGYAVVHDEMIVMPSNFIVGTHELLAAKLFEVLPNKAERIITGVLSSVRHRPKPLLVDRVLSLIFELEKPATSWFGKAIAVSDSCTGCGRCAKHCPAKNITLVGGKPAFSNRCHACLGCIYGCPQNALAAKRFKFIIVKEGYNLERFLQKLPLAEPVDLDELAKGYVWSGVKKYLQE
ncbi:MAG: EFR1 family ferrodoxin [Coriobacteriia bacterium]|nr:EFR1 family ferrodoxin [Coriobacteriia bacterium]